MNNYKNEAYKELARRELERRRQSPPANEQLYSARKQHPYLIKLAEMLQGTPGLEEAGNIADQFNHSLEGTGIPSLAKGALGTGVEMGRGLVNLIPGVNIPKQQYSPLNVNPLLGEAAEITGGLALGAAPVMAGYEALRALPYVRNLPNAVRSILAGGATGAAISPDNRKLGAAIGAGASAAPYLANPLMRVAEELALTRGIAARPLRQAQQEIGRRDINFGGRIPEEIFEEAQQYLPNTLPNRNLINSAREGDYRRLFTLQSDIGRAARQLRRSASGAERIHGHSAEDLRGRLLQSLRNILGEEGSADIANMISRGQRLYRRNKVITKPLLATALALSLGANPIKKGVNYLKELL